VKPSVNWLLALIPVTLALGGAPALGVFFIAAAAILPVVRLLVRPTEQLATYTGDAVGALRNATFGNAPELIIALVALRARLLHMARPSIVGAILANLPLVLGVAFLAGGVRFHAQTYREAAARIYGSMRLIAAIGLTVPSAFNRTFAPEETLREEALLNVGLALVLLAAYVLYLVSVFYLLPAE
jgi:Ca2+:H+ antiporter